MKWKNLFRGVALILVVAAPLGAYIFEFRKYPISEQPEDWSNFGAYLGGMYVFLAAAFTAYTTYAISKYEHENEQISLYTDKTIETIIRIIDFHTEWIKKSRGEKTELSLREAKNLSKMAIYYIRSIPTTAKKKSRKSLIDALENLFPAPKDGRTLFVTENLNEAFSQFLEEN